MKGKLPSAVKLLLALGVISAAIAYLIGARVYACDPNKIKSVKIAPVNVQIPVGGKRKVVVSVLCSTNGNDFTSNTSGRFAIRLVDADSTFNPDDILGTAQVRVGRTAGQNFRVTSRSKSTFTLECPRSSSQVKGTQSSADDSGEGKPECDDSIGATGNNNNGPADLLVEIDNGAKEIKTNHKPNNLRTDKDEDGEVIDEDAAAPGCCVEDDETPSVSSAAGTAFRRAGQALGRLCDGEPAKRAGVDQGDDCQVISFRDFLGPYGMNVTERDVPPGFEEAFGITRVGGADVGFDGVNITIAAPQPFGTFTGQVDPDGSFTAMREEGDFTFTLDGQLAPGDFNSQLDIDIKGFPEVITYDVNGWAMDFNDILRGVGQNFDAAAQGYAVFNFEGSMAGVELSQPFMNGAGDLLQVSSGFDTKDFQAIIDATNSLGRGHDDLANMFVVEKASGSFAQSAVSNPAQLDSLLRDSARLLAEAAELVSRVNELSQGTPSQELVDVLNQSFRKMAEVGQVLQAIGDLFAEGD